MTIELTKKSIDKLCNGIPVQQPIVQLLGYETIEVKNNAKNYRLVLSDGVHMNSYFFLCPRLNSLIMEKEVKYGTIMKIEEYKFMDGENCIDHSARWIIFVQKVVVLVHRNVLGNPQPLINVAKNKNLLINLNLSDCPSRIFSSIEQLENNLKFVKDLNNQSNGICNFVLKLTVIKIHPINTYRSCRVLNMKMEDSSGVVRVSAFNSLSDRMNKIFKENKTYYISDTLLKLNMNSFGHELKLQSYSVVIECFDQTTQNIPLIKMSDFNQLLTNNPNTYCDLLGVCIQIGDVEVCCNSVTQTEITKRDITLVDKSMVTVILKVWGEHVVRFDQKFSDNPVVMVKQAVLKQFNGCKHFSMQKSSVLLINPHTVESNELKKWYKEMVTVDTL